MSVDCTNMPYMKTKSGRNHFTCLTLRSFSDEEEYTTEKNKKNKKKRNKDKHKSKSKMKKKHSRDNIDDEKVDDSDLVTLLNQLVEPLFS